MQPGEYQSPALYMQNPATSHLMPQTAIEAHVQAYEQLRYAEQQRQQQLPLYSSNSSSHNGPGSYPAQNPMCGGY